MNIRTVFKTLFGKPEITVKEKRVYYYQFKVSYPVKNGWTETKEIHASVEAYTESGARRKLNKHVREKIQVSVIDVSLDKNQIFVNA